MRLHLYSALGSGLHHRTVVASRQFLMTVHGPITEHRHMMSVRHLRPPVSSSGANGMVQATGVAAIGEGDRQVGRRQVDGTRATVIGEQKEEKDKARQSRSTHASVGQRTATTARELHRPKPHGRGPPRTSVSASQVLAATGTIPEAALLPQWHHSNRMHQPQWRHNSKVHPPQWRRGSRA